MQKSIFDKIFPPSPGLPRFERDPTISPRPNPRSSTASLASSSPLSHPRGVSPSIKLRSPKASPVVRHDDPFLPIERAAKALERNIQSYLDAQVQGLEAGLGQGDDASSMGSLTSTQSTSTPPPSTSRPRTVPVRQPPMQKITLGGARRGLASSMRRFADLREGELAVIESQFDRRMAAILAADSLEDKRTGLEDQAASAKDQTSSNNALELHNEAQKLEKDIRRLEDELAVMRMRHAQLINQATQTENAVASKLSSFDASIALVDTEIRTFLKRPPVESEIPFIGSDTSAEFYKLHPKRRTLGMAKAQWRDEARSLDAFKSSIEEEMHALRDGREIWRTIVHDINAFEKWFRAEMRKPPPQGPNPQPDNMHEILVRFEEVTEMLDRHQQEALEKDWRLLVAAVGAELEAFREGKELFAKIAGDANGDFLQQGKDEQELVSLRGGGAANGAAMDGSNESLKATLRAMKGQEELTELELEEAPRPVSEPRSESEDDGPGPDLLISHE